MRPIIPTMLALAVLAGCTTLTPAERRAADEATCRDYGFRGGSDAFAECLQRIDLDRNAQRRADFAAFDRNPPVVIFRDVPAPR